MPTLVVPSSRTPTVQALSAVAAARGFDVVGLALADDLRGVPEDGPVHLFGGPRLAARVQERCALALLEPDDDWLANLSERFLRRRVRLMPAIEAYGLEDRSFVKMPREKGLEPGAYHGYELPALPEDERLLVSDLVPMTDEHRFWILDGAVHASTTYRVRGRPDARPLLPAEAASAHACVEELVSDQDALLPSAVVVDVAWIDQPDPGWAVVEANVAWFSAHYAADPDRVLDVVLRAAGPPEDVAPRDARFAGLPGARAPRGRATPDS